MTEGDDGASAVRLIGLNKTLRAECERVAPRLGQLAARNPNDEAQDRDLLTVLIRHAPHFGITAKGDGAWATLFETYIETLFDMPAHAVEEAFSRWKRNELYPNDVGRHSFYPRANELFALAGPYWTKLRTAAWRARRALEKIETTKRIDSGERKEVGASMKSLLGDLAGKRYPPQPAGWIYADWAKHCRENNLVDERQSPADERRNFADAKRARAAAIRAAMPADDLGEIV